jgi:hypothetical protein
MLRKNFLMLRRAFPMLRTVVRATFNEGCCERVGNVFRACCERGYVQHPTSGVFLPPPPHAATMLRLCCDLCCMQHPTSGALPPLLDTTPITCLQHRNSTSATFAKSQWNIKMHMSQHVRVDEIQETKCCNCATSSRSSPSSSTPKHHMSATTKTQIRNIKI